MKACNQALDYGHPTPFAGKFEANWDGSSLGHFDVHYSGHLVPRDKGKARFEGEVWFKDNYNFDPDWEYSSDKRASGQRTEFSERKTRIAHILDLGTNFPVTSKRVRAYRGFGDERLQYDGPVKKESEPSDGRSER